jgi:hypothetical protein
LAACFFGEVLADANDAANTMAAATIGKFRWIKLIRYLSVFHYFRAALASGQLLTLLDARTIISQNADLRQCR